VKKLLFFILLAYAQLSAQEKPLVLATYAYSTNTRLDNLKPLAAYLQQKLGRQVNAVSYPSVQELIAAIRNGEIDIAMINTLGYLSMNRKYGDVGIPLVTLQNPTGGATNYGGCILATTKKLKGSTLALVNKESTSGNLVPRLLFNAKGMPNVEQSFTVYYAGTHKQVIEDLLSGKAGTGGCGCNEYEKYLAADKDFGKKVKLLAKFNNIPLGPVVYKKAMPVELQRQIRDALLTAHTEDPAAFTAFRAGWTEFLDCTQFRLAADADYDQFRQMFGNNESLWKLLDE